MRTSLVTAWFVLPLGLATLGLAPHGVAQTPNQRSNMVDKLPWRHLGPTNMSGRVTDFETVDSAPGTWYVAAAAGGLFKTTNAGTTWTPLFQHGGSASVGDVAVAPSNPDIVWLGTGEENARNSVSWGDGVYKSEDAGKTFKRMGLEKTFQIGHIAIHPEDANTVFVAALGRLWGPSEERGLYRTRDGGKSWEKVLHLDEKTGCIDVRFEPSNPDIVYAVMYHRMRDMFDSNDPAVRFGPKAGIYRSEDGGNRWQRLQTGLPSCNWGRCAIEPWAKRPGTLFALIETERSGWARGDRVTNRTSTAAYLGAQIFDDAKGARLGRIVNGSPAAKAGFMSGDIVIAMDAAKIGSGEDLSDSIDEKKSGDRVKIAVLRSDERKVVEVTFGSAPGSGRGPNGGRLGGQNGNVQSRQGELGYETGGVYRSDDFGVTWKRLNSLIPRPFYFCSFTVDPQNEKNIYVCGIQLWRSTDGGRRFRTCNRGIHVDFHDIWVDPKDSDHIVACCDGGVNVSFDGTRSWEVLDNLCLAQFYHVNVDQSLPYNVYGGLQDNGTWGGPSRTRYSNGATKEDWIKIYSGDGFGAAIDPEDPNIVFATSQGGNVGMVDLRTGGRSSVKPRAASGAARLRFNWNTPFFISPHNPKIFYVAGNFAFRSLNRGTASQLISKRLGDTDRGTATAFAESPRTAGVLYVGTDDGAAWVTRDGGKEWTRIDKNLPDMPGPRYISRFAPSHHSASRVYMAIDGHRSDDNTTYIFVSDDYGESWKSLKNNLPDEAPVRCVCLDRRNARLVFIGTEFGCYASLDRGKTWLKLSNQLPTVPVHDLVIHDRDSDLVAATHGRGIYILDIEPLRQLTRQITRRSAHLFAPQPAYLWRTISRYQTGHKMWTAPRAPRGSSIYLYLEEVPETAPVITIKDLAGKELTKLSGKKVAGIQLIQWNGRARAPRPEVRPGSSSRRRRGGLAGRARGRGRSGRGRGGRPVEPGTYQAAFTFDGKTQLQAIELRPDPLSIDRNSHPLNRR